MAQTFTVTATLLNVRSTPTIEPGNIIGKLGEGQQVFGDPTSSAAWLQVSSSNLSGFASSAFLRLTGGAAPIIVPQAPMAPAGTLPPAVHFPVNPKSALNSTLARHTPLSGFSPRPRLQGQAVEVRHQALNQIVTDLDVTRSVRYTPNTQTFCNIYAYDFCFMAGVYLPRVWWNSKALIAAVGGAQLEVIYDKTVREMTANALHRWLGEWGDDYGWQRCATMEDVQQRANAGDVGLITAERMDPARSGHIVVVMPESSGRRAARSPAGILAPLQSQAGRVNKSYFTSVWWDNPVQYRASGFWAHS